MGPLKSSKMDASKAAGPDWIHPEIAKPPAKVLVNPCTGLYNALPDKGRLPLDWLTSAVVPVHRDGDRDNCSSHRPVSLIFIKLKTLERALLDRIVNHLEAKS